MKRILLNIIGVVSLISLTACDEWLKVTPQTEVVQEDLFTSENGFEDALNGVYIKMKDDRGYGMNLTISTVEFLLSNWDVQTESTEAYLSQHNYGNSGVESLFGSIYMHQYNKIASLNAILGVIDGQKEVFTTPGFYEQVKGECLGLRAYIHFDLLRLYGPVPGTETNDLVLPYVTSITSELHPFSTYSELKTALVRDLDDANSLLATASQNDFSYGAQTRIRMNVEAVQALQSRMYLWFGEKEKAFELASSIIKSTNTVLGKSSDIAEGNTCLTNEQIFALHDFELPDLYRDQMSKLVLKKGNSSTVVTNDLYGNTGTDIRESGLWVLITEDNGAKGYTTRKYQSSSNPSSFGNDTRRIPLIRLSELYLIATETAPDKETAQGYWDIFKQSRNLTRMTLPDDVDALKKEIAKEYRKEFFAEGQAFYAYKRLNVGQNDFLWLPVNTKINYVVPLPLSEIPHK